MKMLLIGLALLAAGCGDGYYYPAVQGAAQGVNNALMMDMMMRQQQPAQIIYPQQNNSNYWQEQRARQEYYDNLNWKMGVRPF